MGLTFCNLSHMTFATDTLTLAQTAYQNALSGKTLQKDGRRLEQHEIADLLNQVNHWTNEVAKETAKASGRSSGSIQMWR